MDLKLRFSLSLSLVTCFVTSSLHCNSASAQVTSDGTTGTIVDANGNSFEINAGTRSGGNLFHSFGDFSVPSGGQAVFNNATDVSNILSRVTGGNISNIDGLIQAQGGANLFLINPAGIIFGQGASLAIGGSFYGSTADSILFEDGEFSAVNNLNQPILTINAPIGLNLRNNPEDIAINGNVNATELADFTTLTVSEDQSLNLIGGDLDLNNAILSTPGGNVTLGGLQGSGTVNINENGNLIFPENVARGNISLDTFGVFVNLANDGQGGTINFNGEGGTINFNGNNIELLNGSVLSGGITANSGFAEAQAGNINLNSTGAIDIGEVSSIENRVNSGGTGNAGAITITTTNLNLTNGGTITASTFAQGNAGTVTIDASDTISVDGIDQDGFPSIISSSVSNGAVGNSGGVNITTANLNLTNGGTVSAITFAEGNAGTITINASDTISIDGDEPSDATTNGGIFSNVQDEAVGNGGGVDITTANLNLTNGGKVAASTFAQGNAGKVTIDASDTISVNGIDQEGVESAIESDVKIGATGDASGVNITTTNLSLTNDGQVSASTEGQGNAGTVTINAANTITINGQDQEGIFTGIDSSVNGSAVGDAGGIKITTTNLNLTNGGTVSASTFAEGNAGTITIDASDTISIDGDEPSDAETAGGIFSSVVDDAVGDAGGIEITTANLSLTNGGTVSSSTSGEGNAGTVTVEATDTISIDGQDQEGFNSGIFSNVQGEAVGSGGGVDITTANLNLTNGGKVAASTFAQGNAGTVTIDASNTIFVDGADQEGVYSSIESDVKTDGKGNAGGVDITTANLNLTNGGSVTSGTLGEGNGGSISVNASESIILDGTTPDDQSIVSGIGSEVYQGAKGNGGSTKITTANLFITNAAVINSSTSGEGNGGNISVNASESITLDGTTPDGQFISAIGSRVNQGAIGNGGSVVISAPDIFITNGAAIVADTFGKGNSGDLTFNISDRLILEENSFISTEAAIGTNANGGDITINAEDGLVAGLLNQNQDNGNDITTKSPEGRGGNIEINALWVLGLKERDAIPGNNTNDIDASGTVDGAVNINSPNSDAIEGATKLPNNPVEPGKTVNQACVSARGTGGNNLVVTGKGGIPNDPTAPLVSELININGDLTQAESPQPAVIQPIITSKGVIIPAQGVEVKENGDVILTAYPTNNNSRIPQRATSCGKS
jgi:filamentous hemagglutinin family protein